MLAQFLEQERAKQPSLHPLAIPAARHVYNLGWIVVPIDRRRVPLIKGFLNRRHQPLRTDIPGTRGFIAYPGRGHVVIDQDYPVDYEFPFTPFTVVPNREPHYYYRAEPFVEYPATIEGCDIRWNKRGVVLPYSWHEAKQGYYEPHGDMDLLSLPVLPLEFCTQHPAASDTSKGTSDSGYKHMSAFTESSRGNRRNARDRNAQLLDYCHAMYSAGIRIEEAERRMLERNAMGYEGTGSNHTAPLERERVVRQAAHIYAWRDARSANESLLGYERFQRRMGGVESSLVRRKEAALLKEKALGLKADGMKQGEIAKAVGRNVRTVRRWFAEEKPVVGKPEPVRVEPVVAAPIPLAREAVGVDFMARIKPLRKARYKGCEALRQQRADAMDEYFSELEAGDNTAVIQLRSSLVEIEEVIAKRMDTWHRQGDMDAVRELEGLRVEHIDMAAEWDRYKSSKRAEPPARAWWISSVGFAARASRWKVPIEREITKVPTVARKWPARGSFQ